MENEILRNSETIYAPMVIKKKECSIFSVNWVTNYSCRACRKEFTKKDSERTHCKYCGVRLRSEI